MAKTAEDRQRIDKWLWHARFAKTRTSAQKLVAGGKVRIDSEKITSSNRPVGAGNVLTLTMPRQIRIIEILAVAERRGPYEQAKLLYNDLSPPVTKSAGSKRSLPEPDNIGGDGRPTKHQRKNILKLKRHSAD